MKVKFTRDVSTKEAKPQTFKKDQVHDFPDDEAGRASAQHWINRGAAEEVTAETQKADKADKADAKAKQPEALVPNVPLKGRGPNENV